MSVSRLYLSVTGTTPPLSASIDTRADGEITAVALEGRFTSGATPNSTDRAVIQLSFASTMSETSNDDRASLAMLTLGVYYFAAGTAVAPGADRIVITGLKIPVRQGERIWLHISNSDADITTVANAHLYINDNFDERLRMR